MWVPPVSVKPSLVTELPSSFLPLPPELNVPEQAQVSEDIKEKPHFLVTRNEILMGRDREYPLTPELEKNLSILLVRVNKLRQVWAKPLIVTSGYRPEHYNVIAGGAANSTHKTCEAVDFLDRGQELSSWLVNNPDILRECGLFLENPKFTRTWAHVDIRPRSNRVFNP